LRNTLWRIEFQTLQEREAEFSKHFRLFDQRKQALLEALARGCARSHTVIFNRGKAWRDLRDGARLFFVAQKLQDQSTPVGSRKRKIGKLLKSLRQTEKLSLQALEDEIGIDLFRAAVGPNLPSYYDEDRSSALLRKADEIKARVEAITNFKNDAEAAQQSLNAPANGAQTMLFPRDCLQGLGRIYYQNTGAIPGRGFGSPFADFAYEFFIAVGLKKFSYDSLVEAIKDAHRRYKNGSWLGQGCRTLLAKKP
jgi:hypothetical protein